MSIGRLLATFYAVLFLALSLFAGISFVQSYQELTNLRAQEAESRRRLADAEERLKEQERYLAQLSSDPEFVENVIRKKLGYAHPSEVVFRFQE
jgi:cell division protein DivIC